MSKLAFRTDPRGVGIPAGQSKLLGTVDVLPFSKIRVIADERVSSTSGVNIRLTMMEGNDVIGPLDILQLTPLSQVTRVYDVPGTKLQIWADAVGSSGSDAVDVVIYGS